MAHPQRNGFSRNWRLLGFLPLAFFIARILYFMDHGGSIQILWMCHLSNLTLAAGLLFNRPIWVVISTYWLALAVPFWLIDVFGFGLDGITSVITHLGGLVIAIPALWRYSPGKRIWQSALAWFLFIQLICRLFTPADLNINFAHAVYRGWESMFTNYLWYWFLTTVGAGLSVYLLDVLRLKVFNHNKVGLS